MPDSTRKVVIVGGVRTPFCRSGTLYADRTNLDLLTAALDGLVERYGLAGAHIDEVVGGAVVTHAKDWNLAREAVLGTKLAPTTPGITMMQACGTGLQAALGIAAKIACGEIDSGIACGSDTTSDPPIVFSKRFAHRLAAMSAKKSSFEKLKVLKGFRPSELVPQAPATAEPRTGLTMGQHCELMAKAWAITRTAQDRLALDSHQRAAAAYADGWHDDLVMPYAGVYRDNTIRADATLDRLADLKPVFDKSGAGTLTAGNSTPLTDGASAVLLASEAWARQRGLPILAYLTAGQHVGNDFVSGEGLLMAPTRAVARLLARRGLALGDFDLYEIHEAFAAQVLATLAAWESPDYCRNVLGLSGPLGAVPHERINVKGSSLAYGHPFAATGGRILAHLAKMLAEGGGGCGLVSICTAGGMGIAAILERPPMMD
ncbi:MAG: acetyl-CoA C-acetyltransferase [Hyphomicrobiaceae bacterium]|nr:acetyl-CoA C-acetyltransferase [Hyphomicrobiaceae bacterium]